MVLQQQKGFENGRRLFLDQGVGRFQGDEGSWRRQQGEGRDYGRSLGSRGSYEGYEDEEDSFNPVLIYGLSLPISPWPGS